MEIEQTENMACERHEAGENRTPCRGSMPSDRRLDPEHEPPLGAHLITPRRGFTHHGIYVGRGRVVQYGGLSWGLRGGPVEEVTLSQFSQGRPVWVRVVGSHRYDQQEVARRARLRLGEDRYSLLTNNCEHFCEWCVRGQPRSYQIDDRMVGYGGVLLKLIELLARTRTRRRNSTAADFLWMGRPEERMTPLLEVLQEADARRIAVCDLNVSDLVTIRHR